jgi:uncharacterized lipoprotein YbaY
MRKFTAPAAAALLLAGCSGAAEPAAAPANLREVATAIGCENTERVDGALMVVEELACNLPNGRAVLDQFPDAATIDAYFEAFASWGISRDDCAIRGTFMVCPEPADLDAVRAAL